MGDHRIHLQGITRTVDQAEIDGLYDLYSDAYKDVHGFRPRGRPSTEWTAEALRFEIEHLGDALTEQMRDAAEAAQEIRMARAGTHPRGLADWE